MKRRTPPFRVARLHADLRPLLAAAAKRLGVKRVMLHSAFVHWCNGLTAEEMASILGEYVTQLAMQGQAEAAARAERRGRKGKDKTR
jgi:hypothetical protein